MRTIIRHSRLLNKGKWDSVVSIARAYASEKDKWLCELAKSDNLESIESDRIQRDFLVADEYSSKFGLQARQWKQALKDAVETIARNWQSLIVDLKPLIINNDNLSKKQQHYCFWVLKSYERIHRLLLRRYPAPKFVIHWADLKHAGNYLNRIIRKHQGSQPRVKKARSFCLDANMYTVFNSGGVQYISIMTLKRKNRLTFPLLGAGAINGNIRVVLYYDKQTVAVHHTSELHARWLPEKGSIEALDFGYTEAFTDTEGITYGDGLGQILTSFSNKISKTGNARNKLHALEKKYRSEGKKHKVNNIRKHNLGYKKKDRVRHKAQASIANTVNEGLNVLYDTKSPSTVVTEDLRHVFTFDKPKTVNRKLSSWTKGVLQDRTEFKALVGCSRHKQVNPAYGSQMCPICGLLWSSNRKGDAFKCLMCGHEANSDQVAAINYLHRSADTEITLYMPYSKVRQVLMERFLRRLECNGSVCLPSGLAPETVTYVMKEWGSLMRRSADNASKRTVPGRTADTVQPHVQSDVGDVSQTAEGRSCPLSLQRSIAERNKPLTQRQKYA